MRVVFMGSAELSCASLTALARDPRFTVVAAVSQPDKPKGRDLKLQPTPVKRVAQELSIPVLQPEKARDTAFQQQLAELKPDLIAVAAYGQILPKSLLELPPLGCLNVHTSLLPKYRGAAPIQWAILDDEPQTGVTIMKMDVGLDTGAIVSQETTKIAPEDDAQTLHDRLAVMGAALLVKTAPDYAEGRLVPRPQPAAGVSYARKIKKEDGVIRWNQPARVLWNRVRGLMPWPGSFTWMATCGAPVLLKIWRAEPLEENGVAGVISRSDRNGIVVGCGNGSLRILELQREGSRRMQCGDFLAGHPLPPGIAFLEGATSA